MPEINPVIVRSFRVAGYRDHGGGMALKVVEPNHVLKRMLVSMESLTHLKVMIDDYVRDNPHLYNQTMEPDDFMTWFRERVPQASASDLENFKPREIKKAFNLSEVNGMVALEAANSDDQVQVFAFTFESLQYLGLQIEELIRRLRA